MAARREPPMTEEEAEEIAEMRGETGRRITLKQLRASKEASRRMMEPWDAWWESVPLGTALNYNGGFDDITATVVVMHTHPKWDRETDITKDVTEKVMYPVALIGKWSSHDLRNHVEPRVSAEDEPWLYPQKHPKRFGGMGTIYEAFGYNANRYANPYTLPIVLLLPRVREEITLAGAMLLRQFYPAEWAQLLYDAPITELKRRIDRARVEDMKGNLMAIDVTDNFPRRAPKIDGIEDRQAKGNEWYATPTGAARHAGILYLTVTNDGLWQVFEKADHLKPLKGGKAEGMQEGKTAAEIEAGKHGGKLDGMTYGVLPTLAEFEAAFEREIGARKYKIRLGASDSRAADDTSIGDGEYSVRELYKGVKELVAKDTEDALSLASTILSTLGIEWV